MYKFKYFIQNRGGVNNFFITFYQSPPKKDTPQKENN